MQKPLRELGLKRLWTAVKSTNDNGTGLQGEQGLESSTEETKPGPNCSLPLLQVWPSADSPRGEADGQSFIFPACAEDATSQNSTCFDINHHNDSGIESTQVSPSPIPCVSSSPIHSPTPSIRRPSSALLHPDHARLLRLYPMSSPEQTSLEDVSDAHNHVISASSSTTSSLTSVAAAVCGSRTSDSADSRRRSSTMTARYSLFDALDLEYALLRAAARGSVGPYSLSESLHKLTFTQSLAFPALARGLAGKRRRSQQNNNTRPLDPSESGLNAFAKVVTALVLVLVSVLVFAVVYKFVRT
ncbi:uncharacterized protein LOC657648 [Tribolium castaneum]|uniref:Uncharacterized protein n=1 Tax=Tribolium castaneum TaxID=7070 RepID=D6WK83_TRICA|nr:PREDICTED: uncharacterized protein LOC657648 [Tribolium castaneum]XP_015835593.1 PREDICTED: uncharacterized protein LOC657648 [Tribolium castaneum]XP_015835594.1 PREDICTED: uncharacterized protein LOC657648 [Tribolium castaneum]XP_015835595.1 PREDICTED: uncharacterized protein LOC657648 [Tribolium castaneum]XP_015835596.1 PREDICTED: uncharacterized protein LOC657648 [Tribolium castaneum]XP_969188.2 PREDICTED: uncharacterized protein LOC657648 [Tribolium castaneum]EFA03617.2 hypothetical pr|eukprot:XP_015835592.1 PREDICTED: uncharacterized protein LOC657648 [Tribolium castaneum]